MQETVLGTTLLAIYTLLGTVMLVNLLIGIGLRNC